uniref:Carrier domain-containing protein n=1 Tax=Arcella intermedia TaxID=1963864 RepID=A0A6B2KWQ6_9EUKA
MNFKFGLELSSSLRTLGQQFGENGLFIVLLTAYKIILMRHTGEEDICVGSLREILQDTTNYLGKNSDYDVFRTYISDDLTFIQALEAVSATYNQAKASRLPYHQIIQILSGKSGFSQSTPFFKTLFNVALSKPVLSSASNDKIRFEQQGLGLSFSPYDLSLTVDLKSELQIVLSAQYNIELIVPGRIEEIFNQLQLLLDQIVKNPNDRIVNYNLLTEKALQVLPSPSLPLSSKWEGSITDHFAARAKEHPDKLAIFYEGRETSYATLFSKSNQLANLLILKGIKPGDVIGLYGHRSPAVVVSIMGILIAGAAYCIMDPAYPTERIKQCMDIANPKAWVQILDTPTDLKEYLNSLPLKVTLTIPQPWDESKVFEGVSAEYPAVAVQPDSLAVVTFTSGSTGIPKGVMGRHTPLTHFYPWMQKEFGITKDDRFSACSGIAHDPLQRDLFTPLFFGAHIYIPTQDDISQPGQLSKWFKKHSINISCFTPAIGQILTTGVGDELKLEALRLAFFVGDCLLKKDVGLLYNLAPNITVINMYGSTETQRSVGYYKVPRDLSPLKEVIIVGKGMQGCQLVLLNKANKLAGIGEVGEIFLRSHHLAKGYIGFPSETEKRFLKNPFTDIEGDKLYRTGDLGRYTLDGLMDCIGRADDQIKIRGFRIELGEISAALGRHPSVKENVTIVRQDKPGEKQLASYVVAWPGKSCDVGDIKSFLRGKLPHYMVPTFIIQLPSLPLTPNGKIDRRALPPPQSETIDTSSLTETQKKLLDLWTELIGRPVPSIESNFFDLGGHSVLVVQTASKMKQLFNNPNINLTFLYQAPTIKELSILIDGLSKADTVKVTVDYVSESRLSDHIRVRADLLPASQKINSVFLTGSTGFLGAYLLSSLLTTYPDVSVYCLVRADSMGAAKSRIEATLSAYNLHPPMNKLIPVMGDLSKEFLGVEPGLLAELAQTVDAVLHNGAMVHWLHSYERLRAINVKGTEELLKFSCTGKLKFFHYVSTTNVYDADQNRKKSIVLENEVGNDTNGLSGGYTQTKWVAEKLVLKANERGIPCKVYRPSYITGDTVNGIWNSDDFLCRFIKGCIQIGLAPNLKGVPLDVSPVDYVADTIIYSLMNNSNFGDLCNFNVVQDDLYSYDAWFECVKGYGYPLEVAEYPKWREVVLSRESDADFSLKPFLNFFSESWSSSLKGPKYDTANTLKLLKNTNIKNSTMDKLMDKYFSYFIQCGFIKPPASPKSTNVNWTPKQQSQILTRNKAL